MITEADIQQFYKDVEKLGLKFPVSAISKATGISKGTVSQYLSGKLSPSETFLDLFYKGFKNVSRANKGQPDSGQACILAIGCEFAI